MIRVLLLLGALAANGVLFAAAWATGSTTTDEQSADWWPCPQEWCDYEAES